MMARRSRRSKGPSDGTKGLMFGTLGLIVIGLLGAAYFWAKRNAPVLDADTNCPSSGPTAIHVILFDRSDPISEQQAQRIQQQAFRQRQQGLQYTSPPRSSTSAGCVQSLLGLVVFAVIVYLVYIFLISIVLIGTFL